MKLIVLLACVLLGAATIVFADSLQPQTSANITLSQATLQLQHSANITLDATTDSCTYSGSGPWEVLLNDTCIIETSVTVAGAILFSGQGNFTIAANGSVTAEQLRYTPTTLNGANIVAVLAGGRLEVLS